MTGSKYQLIQYKGIFPVLLCIAMLYNISSPSAQTTTQTITHKGNVFVLQNMADTVTLFNPETTEVTSVINNPNPVPVMLNNMSIYARGDVDTEPSVTCDMLRGNIIRLLNKQQYTLGDGEYRLKLSNVIVSDLGKIVYYNFDGLEKLLSKNVITPVNDNQIHATARGATNSRQAMLSWKKVDYKTNKYLSTDIEKLVDKAPAYQPAKVLNNPVPYRMPDEEFEQSFTIKNGAIYYN